MTQREYNTGFCNFHYRVIGWNASIRPKRFPGAIRLSFKPQTQERKVLVRTDSGLLLSESLAKHEASREAVLEIVSIPRTFLIDVLGWKENSSGALIEGQFPQNQVELLYETENGGRPVRHKIYNAVFSRPSFDVSTITDNPSADIYKLELTVNATGSGNYNEKLARADSADISIYNNWFD
ncbi:MAG: hypothetical protein J6I46_09700 [Ruminococcus sp.]|nr:hypothetical protein [Ruminococcus sp.]